MAFKIGVDGGGSKTELILIDETGTVVKRHLAVGCNPSVVGTEKAFQILSEALGALTTDVAEVVSNYTLLCMAGSPQAWQEIAGKLVGVGRVETGPDSLPVLELATAGGPGLVLHGGTGSFVAARGVDENVHYAGGLGWRLGDPGSGYDLGRRALSTALLELQGWSPESRLSALVMAHTGLNDAAAITRDLYADAQPNNKIAALAPGVVKLAEANDPTALSLVIASVSDLLDLALSVSLKLFPATPPNRVRTGLSGPILTRPFVVQLMKARSPLALMAIEERPIEGVRRLLLRHT